jgi:hypothetical protein
MNDVADPSPNVRLVRFIRRGESFPVEAVHFAPPDLDVPEKYFQNLRTLSVPAVDEDSHLRFFRRLRAYLSELKPLVSATAVVNSSAPLM